jgi:putative ABC transport system permease protein
MIENLLRDTRYAARSLRRSPGFFVTAVLTLGLATRGNLLLLVARQAMVVVAAGLGAGVAMTLIVTRLLTIFLYGVMPWDPLVMAMAAGALGAVALIASDIPARRATRIDPVAALRA